MTFAHSAAKKREGQSPPRKEVFGLSRLEVGIAFFLVLALISGLMVTRILRPKPIEIDRAQWAEETAHLNAKLAEIEQTWRTEKEGNARSLPADLVIKVNSAAEAELTRLPGIGPKLAHQIVLFRNQSGPFGSIDDLAQVKGIGPKKLQKIRPYLVLD